MKKPFVLSLLVLVIIGILFYLNKRPQPSTSETMVAKETNNASTNLLNGNVVSSSNATSFASTVESTNEMVNALLVTNLDQWRGIIKDLHKSPGFPISEYWDMEQTNRTAGVPVMLAKNGQSVLYKANFVDISVTAGTKIMEVEMHSPIMDIDETRALGLQLCNMLGVDPKDFLAWCDKVGNHWLDAPLYSSRSKSYIGFDVLRAYDNKKPWYINFIIQ